MGLSRNKVAVSEGAAGSPPFYGDRDRFSRICHTSQDETGTQNLYGTFVVQFSGIGKIFENEEPVVWGCSSVGRAPALQAGGHGFESHHLHQADEVRAERQHGRKDGKESTIENGL